MTLLEQQVVMGVFTHRTTYLPGLLESIQEHLPQIPLLVKVHPGPINANMELLRQDFLKTSYRYWVFLDDDIRFLNPTIIHDAVVTLIEGRYAAVGVYSTFDPNWGKNGYQSDDLTAHEIGWVPGYFIMVDSSLVGGVSPDLNLPDPNTSVDTSYCVTIRSLGYRIGISPNVVYHTMKAVKIDKYAQQITNKYLTEKWGDFYFNICITIPNIVGSIPGSE